MSSGPVSSDLRTVGNLGNWTAAVGGVKVFSAASEQLIVPAGVVYEIVEIQAHAETASQVARVLVENASDTSIVYGALYVSTIGSFAIDNAGKPIGMKIGPFPEGSSDASRTIQLSVRAATPATGVIAGLARLRQSYS